jgi:hypothetical protein
MGVLSFFSVVHTKNKRAITWIEVMALVELACWSAGYITPCASAG